MIKEGSKVKWKWGNGYAEGTVEKTYAESVTRTISGTEVKRNGETGDKALYIKTDDSHALKLESEVEHIKS